MRGARASPDAPGDAADRSEVNMVHLALPGTIEWVWILVILVLLFGARKLPELARAMGTSITQFKKGLKEPDGAEQISEGAEREKKPADE